MYQAEAPIPTAETTTPYQAYQLALNTACDRIPCHGGLVLLVDVECLSVDANTPVHPSPSSRRAFACVMREPIALNRPDAAAVNDLDPDPSTTPDRLERLLRARVGLQHPLLARIRLDQLTIALLVLDHRGPVNADLRGCQAAREIAALTSAAVTRVANETIAYGNPWAPT